MNTLCFWSGGKDSTASIILAHIHHLPITEIVFCEVMFDKSRIYRVKYLNILILSEISQYRYLKNGGIR